MLKEKVKKILKIISYVLSVIGGIILGVIVVSKFSNIGDVRKKKKWEKIPGSKTKVLVKNEIGKKEIIKLPVDPITGKQITTKDIDQIGLPENITDGEMLNVKIKTGNTKRRRSKSNKLK